MGADMSTARKAAAHARAVVRGNPEAAAALGALLGGVSPATAAKALGSPVDPDDEIDDEVADGAPSLAHMIARFWTAEQVEAAGEPLITALKTVVAASHANKVSRSVGDGIHALRDNPLEHTAAATVDARGVGMLRLLVSPDIGGDINCRADCEYGGTPLFAAVRNCLRGDGLHGPTDNAAVRLPFVSFHYSLGRTALLTGSQQ